MHTVTFRNIIFLVGGGGSIAVSSAKSTGSNPGHLLMGPPQAELRVGTFEACASALHTVSRAPRIIIVGDKTLQCSGASPDSVLRSDPWQYSGKPYVMLGIEPG